MGGVIACDVACECADTGAICAPAKTFSGLALSGLELCLPAASVCHYGVWRLRYVAILRQLSGKFLLDPWQQLARFKIHRQSMLWREEDSRLHCLVVFHFSDGQAVRNRFADPTYVELKAV
jgi:hypothetical protein